ncbi:efflux RND transporter periplasmic adaptor subunit [Candidatus Agathobaculum pullicola]|uniref:efflux RND transporter periplasmic adaptor subunit n=1 Tax=Candidatus Agathobaculum pullicola TaxID=2838426 RepID=UPI003F8E95FD
MEKKARMVLGATAVVLCALTFWSWKQRTPASVAVRTGVATVQDIYNSITVPGTIEAADSTVVVPSADAVVTTVYASVGETVEQGAILCTLTQASQTNLLLQDRIQSVWSAMAGGEAQTVQSEEDMVLRAPVSGTVLDVPEVGESVFAGVPCVRISDLDCLQVRAQSPEMYAGELESGQRANVTVSALEDAVFGAKVKSLSPVAARAVSLTGESAEATVEAILELTGNVEGLRPGYSATVKIFTDYHADAVAVPMEAICQRGEQEYVFCLEGNRAVQRAVTTGYILESVTEICEGVDANAVVILSPPDSLEDGDLVEVMA